MSLLSLAQPCKLELAQAGAVVSYTPERGIRLSQLQRDVEYLKDRYRSDAKGKSEGRLIMRCALDSPLFT